MPVRWILGAACGLTVLSAWYNQAECSMCWYEATSQWLLVQPTDNLLSLELLRSCSHVFQSNRSWDGDWKCEEHECAAFDRNVLSWGLLCVLGGYVEKYWCTFVWKNAYLRMWLFLWEIYQLQCMTHLYGKSIKCDDSIHLYRKSIKIIHLYVHIVFCCVFQIIKLWYKLNAMVFSWDPIAWA